MRQLDFHTLFQHQSSISDNAWIKARSAYHILVIHNVQNNLMYIVDSVSEDLIMNFFAGFAWDYSSIKNHNLD